MTGRPTDCTPENIEILSEAVYKGLNILQACDLTGISHQTYYAWEERGLRGEKPFHAFVESVKAAKAKRTQERLASIKNCSNDRQIGDKLIKGEWQASAWLEERQNRAEFGRNAVRVKLKFDATKSDIQQVNDMSAEILSKVSSGEMDGEAAEKIMNVLELRRKMIETSEQAKQLAAIEQKLGIVKS